MPGTAFPTACSRGSTCPAWAGRRAGAGLLPWPRLAQAARGVMLAGRWLTRWAKVVPWELAGLFPPPPPPTPPAALPSGFPAVWEPGGSRGGHPSSEFDLVSLLGNSFLCPSLVPEHTNTWEQTVSFPRDYWRPVTPGCSVSRSASSSTSLRPHASWRGCWPPGRPRCPHAAGGAGHWLLPRLTWRQGLPGATVTAACDGEGPVGPEVLSSW